ncbi:hypothetical protein LG293_17200 (plasmid) [Citricoccus nitrophenolicus]
MSTHTVVTVAGLSATSIRRGDATRAIVLKGSTRLGDLSIMDPFGYDSEFAPASQSGWETYADLARPTVHLARQLQSIAAAPARMTTQDGFMVLPDVTVEDLADIKDFDMVCLHVPSKEGQDTDEAVGELITALKAAPTKGNKDEGAEDPRAKYDPYGVLESTPSTLTYPAKVDGVLRLVSISL